MRKNLINSLIPALFIFATVNANAGIVPYQASADQAKSLSKFDQNADSYVTEGEVEAELREKAIDRSIALQKKGASQKQINTVIENMEDSIEMDAEAIIHKFDKDKDELVEPEEIKRR